MERAEYKTTNGTSRSATPDAPERMGHPRRCTGHGRRTPDAAPRERGARPYHGIDLTPYVDAHGAAPDARERIATGAGEAARSYHFPWDHHNSKKTDRVFRKLNALTLFFVPLLPRPHHREVHPMDVEKLVKWREFANSREANLGRMNHSSPGKKRWKQLRRSSTDIRFGRD